MRSSTPAEYHQSITSHSTFIPQYQRCCLKTESVTNCVGLCGSFAMRAKHQCLVHRRIPQDSRFFLARRPPNVLSCCGPILRSRVAVRSSETTCRFFAVIRRRHSPYRREILAQNELSIAASSPVVNCLLLLEDPSISLESVLALFCSLFTMRMIIN